jgi:hypothetical protein
MLQQIEVVAHCAWDEYYMQISKRVGYPTGQGHTVHDSKYVKQFMAIAQHAMSHGYDVRDYVNTALGFIQKSPAYITPKDLLQADILTLYAKARDQRGSRDKAEQEWNRQIEAVKMMQALRPDRYTTLYKVLVSSWSPFDAWFRVLYPDPVDPDLFHTYGQEAWETLHTSPGLRAMLYKLRPAGMEMLQKQFAYFGDAPTQGAT